MEPMTWPQAAVQIAVVVCGFASIVAGLWLTFVYMDADRPRKGV